MADINVERKRTSIWPWIIGLIVLALLIWALMSMFDSNEPDVADMETTQPAEVTTPTGAEAPAGTAAGEGGTVQY